MEKRWIWEPFSLLWWFSKQSYWGITLISTKKDPLWLFLYCKAPSGILASVRMRAASGAQPLSELSLMSFCPHLQHLPSSPLLYFPFTEALNLFLVVPLAGSGPLSDSQTVSSLLGVLVSFDGVPGFRSKRLTHFHVFLLRQRGWVRDSE